MPENETIAFVNSNKAWGGGEKWHLEMATRLRDKGYPVCFVVHTKSELLKKVKESKIPHVALSIDNYSFLNPVKTGKLSRFFMKHHVYSVILNLPSDVKLAGPAAKRAGVKRIMYRRGTALPVNNNFYNRYLFKKIITHLITNSYETKNLLLTKNSGLVDQDKVRVIYNGLDFYEFDSRPVKKLYSKQGNELILGNAGRFVEQKGHRFLIETARKLKQRNIPFHLLLAGEGKRKSSIVKLAKKEGVYDKLIFMGFISDIKSFMASIDIFILTSLWEGFGYVILEAMASKKPVLAFNISSNPEVIKDGYNGCLVPFGDTDALVDKIIALSNDEQRREKMGENARHSVMESFDIQHTMKQIEALLAEGNGNL